MRKDRRNAQSGYSLTELLTIVGMIGVVTLITIPAIRQLMPQYQIRAAASEAAAALRFARQKAISTRTPWKVSFDPNNDMYSYAMLNAQNADMSVAANWTSISRDTLKVAGTNDPWIRTAAVDVQTTGGNSFKDVDCPSDGVVDIIFLRNGEISNKAKCGDPATAVLTFATAPSIVIAVDNSAVRFNRYTISITEVGTVTVTPSKV
ncbi:MAG TPA: GspH/FimT family pseudopilin [Thermoanaerobaculia bacterium]|nr:GspH/FimT family pseudopilin [Thermoanaerobaculia bacterium]